MTAALFAAGAADLAIRATLLIGAAWAAALMLRKAGASAATRHLAWLLGIAALLALPIAWWLAPPLPLPILRAEAAIAAAEALPPAANGTPIVISSGAPGWDMLLLAAYLIGVAMMLLRFAIGRHMVSLLWRDAEPARDAAWRDLLSSVSREMRLSRTVELRIARGPAMPMTWGSLAPKLLLPAESSAWPPDQRRLVLLHELAHVARRDSLSRTAASLACMLYWFHPGAWFAARQLRMEQECAADDRVLAVGAAARPYALSLLDLSRRVAAWSWPDHAAAMSGMHQLERRLVSITTPARRERPGPTFLYASAAIAIAFLLAVAAGVPVRPLPALPDPPAIETGLETSPPTARIVPVAAEDRSDPEARMADRAAIVARTDGRPRNPGDGFEAPRAAAPSSQAEGRAQAAAGQPFAPAAQGHEAAPFQGAAAGRDGQDAPAQARQPAAYGPPRPQPLAEEQASDPRIPAPLRRGNDGRGAHAGSAGGRGLRPFPVQLREGGGVQLWPGMVLGNGRTRP